MSRTLSLAARWRRSWIVIITTSRTPTPIRVISASPSTVASTLSQELKSRLRTHASPA